MAEFDQQASEISVLLSPKARRRIGRSVLAVVLLTSVAACSKAEDRAEQHYQKGLKLMAKGDMMDARVELSTATKFMPNRVDAWRAQVDVNERIGANALQFQALRRVVELDPDDEDAKIRLANFMLRGGAPDAAAKALEAVTRSDGKAEFHGVKASILLALKDPSGALQEARRANEIDPTNADSAIILATERVARNDIPEALKLLNVAKAVDEKDTRIARAQIELLQRTGDLSKAESTLRGLVEKNPGEVAVRSQLVQVLIRQKKLEEAEKELRAIADVTPADSKPVLDLVRFIIATRGSAAGRQELQTRISKGGDMFPYEMALAEVALGERKPSEAVSVLERLAANAISEENKNTAKVKLAELKLNQRDIPAAEQYIAQILDADRRNVGALRLRAAIRLDRGETDAAISDLREALNEQPKSGDLLLLMAQAYERNGQKELAERQFADALRSTDFSPPVALRFAAYLQREGSFPRAEEVLTQSSLRNSSNVDLLSALAQIRLARKNWSGAREIADVIAKNPATLSLAEQIRAAVFAGLNKPDESLAALELARIAAPDALPPTIALVRAYIARKDYEKPEKLLRDLLAKSPDRVEFLVMLAQVQAAKGRSDEAIETLDTVISLHPKERIGYTSLADFYVQQKKLDVAISTLERGLKFLPGDIDLRTRWAGLQSENGDHERAIEEYEALAKDQPNSLIAVNNLASMLLEYRSDKVSVDRAQLLVEKIRGVSAPQFMDTVGWALYLRGDFVSAKPILEQAKLQLPNSAVVRYHLGMVYRKIGDEPSASGELKAALALEAEGSELRKKIQLALE